MSRGSDEIVGGSGQDLVDYVSSFQTLVYDAATGRAFFNGDTDSFVSLEEVRGSSGDDVLMGGEGRDALQGSTGKDLVSGGGGDDRIAGGGGRDALAGNDGHDILIGGGPGDAIDGGPGTDRCTSPSRLKGAEGCELPHPNAGLRLE